MRNIVEIVQAMERSVSWQFPEYVFRGEPACFEKVSSGLFRTYKLEKEEGGFSIENVEHEMVEKARSFSDIKDSFDILCEIQHRGGRTNQIDFTRDFGVALFFACGTVSDMEQEPGRVVMLQVSDEAKNAGILIRDITHPIHMAAAQKSVFVCTDSGYLDDQHLPFVNVWTIDVDEKQEVLEYLESARGINSRSIFMDISGFIRYAHEYGNANAWFDLGKKMFLQGDFDKAIEAASNYLRLAGRDWEADVGLHLRGQAYYRKGDRVRAFQDLRPLLRIKHVLKPEVAKLFGSSSPIEKPAYPLPDDIQTELVEWCKEQERIEKEAHQKENKPQRENWNNPMLKCVISVSYMTLIFKVLTDTGYSYGQAFSQGAELLMTWPSTFLDYDAACWWSFYGDEHQHITVRRKTVPEDFEVAVKPKSGSSAAQSKVTVKFFAYDAEKQEVKKNDTGEYELVSLARPE